jgi:hypothetical protein
VEKREKELLDGFLLLEGLDCLDKALGPSKYAFLFAVKECSQGMFCFLLLQMELCQQ